MIGINDLGRNTLATKTIKVAALIKILQDARRRTHIHCMAQHSPADRTGAIFELGLIAGLLGDALKLKSGSKEHKKFITQVWGLDRTGLTTKVTKEVKQIKRESEEYIAQVLYTSQQACKCDGGNTTGCSACVAEREVKRLKAAGLIPTRQTNAERQCP